ncbi:hypothetical protein CK934_10795 [Chitinophaga sp. MD30]|nr:hypothetical protein CK934_10795 [Chitinophaga sp. MD30]
MTTLVTTGLLTSCKKDSTVPVAKNKPATEQLATTGPNIFPYEGTQEYATLDVFGQKLSRFLNEGTNKLASLEDSDNYDVVVRVSAISDSDKDNYYTIVNTARVLTERERYVVTGLGSALKCIALIKKWMNDHNTSDIDIHIRWDRKNNSAIVTWG